MKDANVWDREMAHAQLHWSSNIKREDTIAIQFIKAIQLDAWKQGMSDAADIMTGSVAKDIIEKAKDNKTTL